MLNNAFSNMLCVAPHSRSYLSDTLDIKNVPKSTNGINKVEPVPLTLSLTSILFFMKMHMKRKTKEPKTTEHGFKCFLFNSFK